MCSPSPDADDSHPFAAEADEAFLEAIGYDEEEEWGDGGEGAWEWEEGATAEEGAGKKERKKKKLSAKERREEARAKKRAEKGGAAAAMTEIDLEEAAAAAGATGVLDDYYELEFEDVVGDMPTRFKYAQGERVDFGITPEQVRRALNPQPYTLHLNTLNLNPQPSTLSLTPYTLHPTLYTLHPEPQPSTLNPQP
jgi:protein KRI1